MASRFSRRSWLYAGLCAIVLVPPAGCLQAGCVRNSDCVSAEWCIDTKCVPRPVDGGLSESDGGSSADAAISSDAASSESKSSSTSTTASTSTSKFLDAGSSKPDAANDAGNGKDASASSEPVPQM